MRAAMTAPRWVLVDRRQLQGALCKPPAGRPPSRLTSVQAHDSWPGMPDEVNRSMRLAVGSSAERGQGEHAAATDGFNRDAQC